MKTLDLAIISRYRAQREVPRLETVIESVPVPADVSKLVAEDPVFFGLDMGSSKRQTMGYLLMRGVESVLFDQREKNRKKTYEMLALDDERESAEDIFQDALNKGHF